MTDALRTLYMICHNNTERKNSRTMITSNERSEAEGCNDFHKMKIIVLLIERHDSRKAICLYTLTYIDTKELVPRREEIMLQSNCN